MINEKQNMSVIRLKCFLCLCLWLCMPISPQAAQPGQKCQPTKLMNFAESLMPEKFAGKLRERMSETVAQALCTNEGTIDPRGVSTRFRAKKFYDYIGTGEFISTPTVTWNGFDDVTETPSFRYKKSDFAYVTADGRRIKPGAMDTDGGSTPRALHSTKKFAPWMFGPAYIIHDWIFVAQECDIAPDNNIDFEQSALILAEAIKTLMEKGFTKVDGTIQRLPKSPETVYLIYEAVRSKIALKMWEDNSGTNCL